MSDLQELTTAVNGVREEVSKMSSQLAVAETNHTWIDKKLTSHDSRLSRHSERLDDVEKISQPVAPQPVASLSAGPKEWGVRLVVGGAFALILELAQRGLGA